MSEENNYTVETIAAPKGTEKLSARQKWNVVGEYAKKIFWIVAPFAVLIFIWEMVRLYSGIDPRLMPSMKSVVGQLAAVIVNGILPAYSWQTVRMLLVSFAVSTVVGYIIGLAMGLSNKVCDIAMPVLRYFNSLPGIAWTPMFLIWFGFNTKTVLAVVLYTFLFPVIFNTMTGIRLVPNTYRQAILTMGGSRWRVIRDVLLQGSLPSLIIGIRTGFGYGWRAIIGAEIISATGGLGYMIFQARSTGQLGRIVAGMIVIGVGWSLMDWLILRPLERITVQKWALVHQ